MTEWPTELEFDSDHYPTAASLARFDMSLPAEPAGEWLTTVFPKLVDEIGYGETFVSAETNWFGKPIWRIRYSTGGWSGQESFIEALHNTMAHCLYWQESRRGGHYVYEVPRK